MEEERTMEFYVCSPESFHNEEADGRVEGTKGVNLRPSIFNIFDSPMRFDHVKLSIVDK